MVNEERNWKGIGRPLRVALIGSGQMAEQVSYCFGTNVTLFRASMFEFEALDPTVVDAAVVVQEKGDTDISTEVARILRDRLLGVALVVGPWAANALRRFNGVVFESGYEISLARVIAIAAQTTWTMQEALGSQTPAQKDTGPNPQPPSAGHDDVTKPFDEATRRAIARVAEAHSAESSSSVPRLVPSSTVQYEPSAELLLRSAGLEPSITKPMGPGRAASGVIDTRRSPPPVPSATSVTVDAPASEFQEPKEPQVPLEQRLFTESVMLDEQHLGEFELAEIGGRANVQVAEVLPAESETVHNMAPDPSVHSVSTRDLRGPARKLWRKRIKLAAALVVGVGVGLILIQVVLRLAEVW